MIVIVVIFTLALYFAVFAICKKTKVLILQIIQKYELSLPLFINKCGRY